MKNLICISAPSGSGKTTLCKLVREVKRELIWSVSCTTRSPRKNEKDGEHESIGYEYLKKFFKKEIVEPIKYHVLAKRYLARDKKYFNFLSEASITSLKLQGGVLNENESKEFEKKEYFKNAVLVRKFDEAAKKIDIKMKSIDDYKSLLNSKLI